MSNETQPTEAALKCAGLIVNYYRVPHIHLGDLAKLIDEHCDLPRKNRICLLAQGVVDAWERRQQAGPHVALPLTELREALKTK